MPKKYLTKKQCKEFARIHSAQTIRSAIGSEFLEETAAYGSDRIENEISHHFGAISDRMFKTDAEVSLSGSQQIIDYVRANF